MQRNSYKRDRTYDHKLNILILQIITVAIVLLFALCIKLFGGKVYTKLSLLYHEKFDDITLVSDVLEPSSDNTFSSDNELDYASDNTNNDNDNLNNGILEDDVIESSVVGYVDDYSAFENTVTVSAENQSYIWPVDGKITSQYGYRVHPITKVYSMHGGIDIAANIGTDIKAAYSGVVSQTGYSNSYGYYVIISHGDNIETLYAHCSKILCEKGDVVPKGEAVALVGTTGRSTGPHLHFEIRVGGCRVNPKFILGEMTAV